MSLLDKLRKNSKIAEATTLEASTILDIPFEVSTLVIAINVALSGNPNGGLTPGMIQVAGPSKHFKTNFSLVMCAAYMKKFKDAVMIFYDSEFGASKRYFKAAGIDPNRVLHCPIKDIEQLKQDLSNQLKELNRKDDVIIFIDSVGNLASRKEVEDAINEKAVADMSRAKALKSLWRIVTPELTMKAIPLIAVNHTYKEIGMFPKDIVGGGTGGIYSANDIWIVSRSQEKVGTEIQGYTFTINIEKSRRVKEKSKIPITVMFDGGIQKESGLLDWALEFGFLIKPKVGWYQKVNPETGELIGEKNYRAGDLNAIEFEYMTSSEYFENKIIEKFRLSESELISSDELVSDVVDGDDEYESL